MSTAVRSRPGLERSLVERLVREALQVRGGNGQTPAAGEARGELRAVLTELTERGIIVRDPSRGLIDFPAKTPTGREYLLCWLDGEDAIEWWHWPDAGFAGRTRLSEPPS